MRILIQTHQKYSRKEKEVIFSQNPNKKYTLDCLGENDIFCIKYIRIFRKKWLLFQRLFCVIELSVKYFETRMHSSGCVPSAAVAVSGGCLPGGGGGVCQVVDRMTKIKISLCCNYVADGNKLSYNICKMVMILGYTFRCRIFYTERGSTSQEKWDRYFISKRIKFFGYCLFCHKLKTTE